MKYLGICWIAESDADGPKQTEIKIGWLRYTCHILGYNIQVPHI